jgi:hypothetical protein
VGTGYFYEGRESHERMKIALNDPTFVEGLRRKLNIDSKYEFKSTYEDLFKRSVVVFFD